MEAWFYLCSLRKPLRILGQHQKCKFCMGISSVLLILPTEPLGYRLRAKSNSNLRTNYGKEIFYLLDRVTQA